MGQSFFSRAAFNAPTASLGAVAPADVQYVGKTVWHATEHWLPGEDGKTAASLTGLVAGGALTPQSAAPAYGDGYATVTLDDGKALLTPIDDSAEWSAWAIVQVDTSQVFTASWLFGTITASGVESPLKGAGVFLSSNDGGISANLRSATGSTGTMAAIANPAANGECLFVGYSVSVALKKHTLFVGAPTPLYTEQSISSYGPAARKIAVGNGYVGVTSGHARRFASFGVLTRPLSPIAFEHIYRQQKQYFAGLAVPKIVH